MQKTARQNTKYSRNERSLKLGHLAKAITHEKAIYSLCKMVSFGQKLKMPKHAKNRSKRTLKLFCAKNSSKKNQIFEKWDKFENRPSCKGYSLCIGYSLCKMVSLGQKVKMPKTCEKPFYKNIKVVVCKTPLAKTPNIRQMRQVWKSAILQRLEPLQRL